MKKGFRCLNTKTGEETDMLYIRTDCDNVLREVTKLNQPAERKEKKTFLNTEAGCATEVGALITLID